MHGVRCGIDTVLHYEGSAGVGRAICLDEKNGKNSSNDTRQPPNDRGRLHEQ